MPRERIYGVEVGLLALPLPSDGAGWCPGSPPHPPRRWQCWFSGPPAWLPGDAPGCWGWKNKHQSLPICCNYNPS